ncbi:MAG: DegT/DnrJ/EryC1/StrS family aminotransferase [Oscillospiraceae bacterium]|nr:DegT/DnrJ/EryC1/StrS family aminotransferase [Oscillospiraceae bacterium]MCL2278977.1 DegT/DnrJ/EryC1/StrS family aminotransferase [Oscillospiraceae bacterium]
MTVPFLNLTRQYEQLSDRLEAKVVEVMRSGAYIGGKYVENFEADMREHLGVKHVISCANGTDAIMLALRACGVSSGDEVITTPFTFFASAEAIAAIGAVPVFVDVFEADFNIDTTKIEAAITDKTKAILPVHIFGWPCDMDGINSIARKHNLKVVEDAAQAIGCEYKGKKIGASENLVTFSFYPTKNLGAFGDAGMITTDNDDFAVAARAFREHGMAKNGAKAREILYGIKDDLTVGDSDRDALYNPYKYFNYLIAYNSRLDAMQAAILSIKLKHLDEYNAKRSEIALLYNEGLKGTVKTPDDPKHGKSCYHQYVVRTERKDELAAFLAEKGVGSGAFYPVALHLQKAFEYLGYKKGDLPIAEMLCNQTVCLPIFPELTRDEVNYVIQAVKNFAQ